MSSVVLGVALIIAAPFASAQEIEVPRERVEVADLTPDTERAIARGLVFMQQSQNGDGSWGQQYKIAHTAVALMAFLLPGNIPGEGEYGDAMDDGLSYLLKMGQKHAGYFADETSETLYQHSLGTLALAESWGQSLRPEVGPALKRAVDVLMRAQCSDGGWRYGASPTAQSDLSCTVMAVQALAAAKESGIVVPEHVTKRALRCVRGYQDVKTGYFAYVVGGGGSPSLYRTGAGPLSLFMLGDRKSTVLKRGMTVLMKYPADRFASTTGHYFLAHYYCIQASYQAGDALYNYWYPNIRAALLARQSDNGSWAGGGGVSPSFNTSLSILILGVPYRYLPIYQR